MYRDLLNRKFVVGAGVGFKNGTTERAVVVLVEKKLPLEGLRAADVVPPIYPIVTDTYEEDLPTDVIEVGHLVALQHEPITPSRRDVWNPAPGGVSAGHVGITAGTLGMWVMDPTDNRLKGISNNHVFANSNEGKKGDFIVQPGPLDDPESKGYVLARLDRYVPIHFEGEGSVCPIAGRIVAAANTLAAVSGRTTRIDVIKTQAEKNYCDAALADPIDESVIDNRILELGVISGVGHSQLGEAVRKSGRTTGLTSGRVTVMEATVTVDYGGGRRAIFDGQVITTPMSAGGDSGSIVINSMGYIVGLLFAGSDQVTIYSPWNYVQSGLGIYA